MIKEVGQVVAIDGDTVWVQTQTKTSCSTCQVNKACGTGIISKSFSQKVFLTPMANHLQAQVNDQVEVGIPEDMVVKASLLVYFLPLLTMISGLIIGRMFFPNVAEGWLILSALIGLSVGFVLTRYIGQKISKNKQLEPVLLRIVNKPIAVKQIETSA